jgi:hypothetical protein
MPAATSPSSGRTPQWLRGSSGQPLAPEEAAGRITAYVYGNVLVLAALVALHPDDLTGPKALGYVVGTGVSTFVAHVFAESVGARVRTDRRPTAADLHHELRDSLPILSATAVPALLLSAALLGRLDAPLALGAAIGVIVLRLAALGWIVGHLRRRQASMRTFIAGVLLAGTGAGIAVLKWWLTH